ncbi:ArsR/SmtB family transcription factor [Spartinivicinus poritis]|uniref:Metalloregulator ArsR/SmtB family transcription factor n=1 Tax=Spartinivicinus poritis TaxID=2994640 RepID=A0ABT5U8G4_9GAMM|nr:metalloregulator ArsR/SmtB family transcription factor [Spartinivicinus sp. A2-2]MDE1462656.1 metalloregulator ArsR/SmtB family transcription factor [Spartinivicinus sp. A2-2]
MTNKPSLFFKCLSDDTRLQCLMLLCSHESLCVCDLAAAINISQPKVSRHLAQLRSCGLVVDERRGQWVYYALNPLMPGWMSNIIAGLKPVFNKDPGFKQVALRAKCCASPYAKS